MPYPSEHSLRIMSPSTPHIRVRRTKGSGNATVQGVKIPENISVIWYVVKSNGKEVPRAQALRFPVKTWTEKEARAWIKKNKLKGTFEPAAKEKDLFNSYINETKSALDIIIKGIIDLEQAEKIESLLNKKYKTVNVSINSPGGSVWEGLEIYNILRDYPGKVNVKILGLAASMASVIAMAADEITMPEAAAIMIHKPMLSMVLGPNSDDLRKNADILDKIEGLLISTYKKRLNKSREEIAEMLRAETWLTSNEAYALGLADVITDEDIDPEYFDLSEYNNCPEHIYNMYALEADEKIKQEGVEQMETQEIKNEDINFIQKLKNVFNYKEETDMSEDIT